MNYESIRESVRIRVQSNNQKVLTALVKQVRSPVGVTPFLGAGISAPLKYQQWGEVLRSMAAEQLGGSARSAAEEALAKEDYLRAAGLVARALGREDFQNALAEEFSDDRLASADLAGGSFAFLPLITTGPVVTTNFDRVIEHVFERAGHDFEDHPIFGANPNEVVRAFQQNRRVLWKIHGDRSDHRSLVFTDEEYERHYQELPSLLVVAFLNRPALFIGSSLHRDRTTDVLIAIHAQHPAARHYAFEQIPATDEAFDDRVAFLKKMGVRPIWYPMGAHGEIPKFLFTLVHAAAAVPMAKARVEAPAVPQAAADRGHALFSAEMAKLEIEVQNPPEAVRDVPQEIPPYGPIVNELANGRIAFFLGAGACMGRLPLSGAFYSELFAEFDGQRDSDIDALGHTRVAQLFADRYGRDALYSRVKQQLGSKTPEPTPIHWFIATLDERLRAKGYAPTQQWVVTTNYDDWMETALRISGQSFHLFTYRVSGPHAGSYIYQSPEGLVYSVDRPENFRTITADGNLVLIKLHGGMHAGIDLPVTSAFMHRDFVELAGRIPNAMPRAILDQLTRKSLLFLGSGLGDDSIESFVRSWHESNASGHRSGWAIQWQPRPEMRVYWRQLGIDIIHTTLQTFLWELNRKLGALPPA